MENDTTPTASRREVFLTIALGVAKHNLPAPELISLHTTYSGADLDIDQDVAGAVAWSEYLGIPFDRTAPTNDGLRTIHVWYGKRDGWSWHIRTVVPNPVVDTDTALGLADRVVEAIAETLKADPS